jgi:hypothetical protein
MQPADQAARERRLPRDPMQPADQRSSTLAWVCDELMTGAHRALITFRMTAYEIGVECASAPPMRSLSEA